MLFVHDRFMYNYAILRVVPRVERKEFVNVTLVRQNQPPDVVRAAVSSESEENVPKPGSEFLRLELRASDRSRFTLFSLF